MSLIEDPKRSGIYLVYYKRELYFERHEARDLYRDLGKIIKRWDSQQVNSADGLTDCACGGFRGHDGICAVCGVSDNPAHRLTLRYLFGGENV